VTCTGTRGWTCCRQMACKRSAVRARLAPLVRSEIRTVRTASTAGKYSNGGRLGRRTCVRIGHLPPAGGCWQDTGFQALNRLWSECHVGKSPPRRSRDSCHPVTTRPAWRAMSASDCCRVCKWPSRTGRPGGPIHSQEPRLPTRAAFADGGLGALRRWCQCGAGPAGALRRSGAGLRRGASLRACRRAAAPREEPGAAWRTARGRAPAGRSPTQGFDAADARSSPPPMAGRAAHRRAARSVPEPSPPVR